ncbi:hypothetical protein RJ035_001779 [Blastomyces gilchristii]
MINLRIDVHNSSPLPGNVVEAACRGIGAHEFDSRHTDDHSFIFQLMSYSSYSVLLSQAPRLLLNRRRFDFRRRSCRTDCYPYTSSPGPCSDPLRLGRLSRCRCKHVHMIPTLGHRNPAQVREKARFEVLNQYGSVRIEDVEVTAARMSNDSLSEVTDSNSRAWKGKKIIQATGSANIFPDIPGYADCWAKRINIDTRVVFQLSLPPLQKLRRPRAARSGVLAVQTTSMVPMVIHLAENAATLISRVTIYTHGSEEA